MPYREFQVNEVLTAANVNTYLMNQAVMTFADSTARAAALGTPTAGMVTFLADSTAVQVYSGSTAVGWTSIGGGGGASVSVSTAAPSSPSEGNLWWDSDDGKLYIYYDDGTSQQWVDAAGPSVAVQSTAPTGYQGQLWLDSDDGSMYVYYTDPGGTASSWIGAVSRSGGILQVVSTAKTDTFSTTSTTMTDVTGLSATITPRSTSSKIYVVADVSQGQSTLNARVAFQLVRDSTNIAQGDAAGTRLRATMKSVLGGNADSTAADSIQMAGINFLDSPSTTSSTTYKLQMAVQSGTGYVNRAHTDADTTGVISARTVSVLTLIEVAG